jgi:C4-type Zn-finger protein
VPHFSNTLSLLQNFEESDDEEDEIEEAAEKIYEKISGNCTNFLLMLNDLSSPVFAVMTK